MNVSTMSLNPFQTRERVTTKVNVLTGLLCVLLGAYIRLIALEPSATFLQSTGLFKLNHQALLNISTTAYLYYGLALMIATFLVDWVDLSVLLFVAAVASISGNLEFGSHETATGLIHATALVSFANGITLLCLLKILTQVVPRRYFPLMFGALFAVMCVSPALAASSFIPLLKNHQWPLIDEIMSVVGLVLYGSLLLLLHWKNHHQPTTFKWQRITETYRHRAPWISALIAGFAATAMTTLIGLWFTPIAESYFHYNPYQSTLLASLSFWGLITGILSSSILVRLVANKKMLLSGNFLVASIGFWLICFDPQFNSLTAGVLCFFTGMAIGATYLTYTLLTDAIPLKHIGLGFGLIALGSQFGNLKAVGLIYQMTHQHIAMSFKLPLLGLIACFVLALALPTTKTQK